MAFLDRADKTDRGMDTTNAYLRHALVGVGESGQRRFVPRASTRLTTKLHLSVQGMARRKRSKKRGASASKE
jgi:hypothetical protein